MSAAVAADNMVSMSAPPPQWAPGAGKGAHRRGCVCSEAGGGPEERAGGALRQAKARRLPTDLRPALTRLWNCKSETVNLRGGPRRRPEFGGGPLTANDTAQLADTSQIDSFARGFTVSSPACSAAGLAADSGLIWSCRRPPWSHADGCLPFVALLPPAPCRRPRSFVPLGPLDLARTRRLPKMASPRSASAAIAGLADAFLGASPSDRPSPSAPVSAARRST